MEVNRDKIRQRLAELREGGVTYDAKHREVKELQSLTAEALLQVLDTLDRIDANQLKITETLKQINDNQVELGSGSETLARTSNTIQKWMLGLTIVIVLVSIVTLIVALR